ncbi:MAG TPA: hypothetical protein VMU93_16565 [Caulobacteraceae bacterium]|nr:hypothetical protein [Caulobacteraceae bacterium]
MNAILYPVAPSAEAALGRPLGRAARQREAAALAGEAVHFVSEDVGPAYASRDAALDAWAGRVDDERPGKAAQPALEDRFCALREVTTGAAAPPPREPAFADGRRWPPPAARPAATAFRLSVSYWRVGGGDASIDQARAARRRPEAAGLEAGELRAMARQPLRPVKPQQPLDVGLFESPAPEAPHILIPDD